MQISLSQRQQGLERDGRREDWDEATLLWSLIGVWNQLIAI
jgi:hypothetical protein